MNPATPPAPVLVAAAVALGAGTYACRLAGPVLRTRLAVRPAAFRVLACASVVLLTALAVTSAAAEGHRFAGWSRVLGVAVGAALAGRRAPLPLVVLAAAATAAAARLAGLP